MILGRSANIDVNNTIIFFMATMLMNNIIHAHNQQLLKKQSQMVSVKCFLTTAKLNCLNILENHLSEQVPRKLLPIMPRQSLSLVHKRTWQWMVISTRPGYFCKSKIVKQIVKCFQKISYCGNEERKKIGTFHHEFGILSQSRDKS